MNRFAFATVVLCFLTPSLAPSMASAADKKVDVGEFYFDVKSIDLQAYLPPPPAPDSAEARAELAEVHHYQDTRTPERVKIAQEDQTETVFAVVRDSLGPHFTQAELPVTSAFFERLLAGEGKVVDPAKDAWARPRPFVFDATLTPCAKKSASASYPSGHTATAYMTALVLADMLPERRAEVFDDAARFAESRILCGVHYRSDINASKIAAAVIIMQARANPAFRRDFAASKAEIRRVLGLEK